MKPGRALQWPLVVACLLFPAGLALAADAKTADDPVVEIPLNRSAAPAAAPSAPIPSPETARIDSLTRQLGDADYRKREEAAAKLKAMGPGVLPALKKTRDAGGDPEVASRADAVIRHFERPRLPGPLTAASGGRRGRGGGARITLRATMHNGIHTVEGLEVGGRLVRITQGPGGIQMSVTGLEDGKKVTREFQARSPEELQRQNPEAFQLFEQSVGGGRQLGVRALPRRIRQRDLQLAPLRPIPDENALLQEMVLRQLQVEGHAAAAADLELQQREMLGLLDELRLRARRDAIRADDALKVLEELQNRARDAERDEPRFKVVP